MGTVLWMKAKVFLAWYLFSVGGYSVLIQKMEAGINDNGIICLQRNFIFQLL